MKTDMRCESTIRERILMTTSASLLSRSGGHGRGAKRRTQSHGETHRSGRAGWLRAAVLGSNDAIVSTASLMIGVAASSAPMGAVLVAGVSGLVAGSMSMALGEYVSVSSQRDAERADIEREKRRARPAATGRAARAGGDLREAWPRQGPRPGGRGAAQRARSARRPHARRARDRRGTLSPVPCRRPGSRRRASRRSPWSRSRRSSSHRRRCASRRSPRVSLVSLAALGAFGGHLGGAPLGRAALRVTLGGALAMARDRRDRAISRRPRGLTGLLDEGPRHTRAVPRRARAGPRRRGRRRRRRRPRSVVSPTPPSTRA